MGDVVRGQTSTTFADRLRANWYGPIRYMVPIVAIVIAGITFAGIPRSATDVEFVIALAATLSTVILFVGVYVLFMVVLLVFFALRLGKDQRKMTFELGSDAIVIADGTGATLTTPWSVVRRARESKRAINLNLRPMGIRYIPRRAFVLADIPALRALIGEKLGAKAKLAKA